MELQILPARCLVGLGIIVFNKGTRTTNQEQFHQFLPIVEAGTLLESLDTADKYFAMLLKESTVTTQFADILLRTDAQIIILADKEFQLTAEVREILVVWCGRQQQHLTILSLDQRLDVLITLALVIAQIVAFIHDNQTIVTGIVYINGLGY